MFKKNETVYLIRRWNDQMDWSIRKATVASCGKVRMTLHDAGNGEFLGRDFSPSGRGGGYLNGPPSLLVVRGSFESAAGEAKIAAEEVRAFEIPMIENIIKIAEENGTSRGYINLQKTRLENLRAASFKLLDHSGDRTYSGRFA